MNSSNSLFIQVQKIVSWTPIVQLEENAFSDGLSLDDDNGIST